MIIHAQGQINHGSFIRLQFFFYEHILGSNGLSEVTNKFRDLSSMFLNMNDKNIQQFCYLRIIQCSLILSRVCFF